MAVGLLGIIQDIILYRLQKLNAFFCLRRHRRFVENLLPKDEGWTITFANHINIPIESTTSKVVATVPFTYALDSGT